MNQFATGLGRAIAAGMGAVEVVAGAFLAVAVIVIANAADRANPWGASFLVMLSITAIVLPTVLTGTALRSQRPAIVLLCVAGLIVWPITVISAYLVYA